MLVGQVWFVRMRGGLGTMGKTWVSADFQVGFGFRVVAALTVLGVATALPAGGESVPAAAGSGAATAEEDGIGCGLVPDWVADAVFYQIFPERFHNGDSANDPTRESLEDPAVPASWRVSPWTGDWYARDAWEREHGDDFFEHGVFHRRYGGDLQGVIDRLDYLEGLGITAIYFNPVFHARSLHKYDASSFHHVDPHFGPDPAGDLVIMGSETADPATWRWTAADRLFLDLLREAHDRGIRVVIDGVFNHTGRDFFAFDDLRSRQTESPYRDWYVVEAFDDPATPENEFRYKGWWGVETLPEFADTPDGDDLHPGPRAYVMAITRRWMDPDGDGDPSDGIDGWRLDVAREVPARFWRDWHDEVKRINPEAYTVAEEWDRAREFLAANCFDATMNYFGFAFPVKGYLVDGTLPASVATRQLRQRLFEHPERARFGLLNLVDSHDTDRLASMIVNAGRGRYQQPERHDYDVGVSPRWEKGYDVRRPSPAERRIQRMVALMQMTYVGPPMIYYGTEAGMWGADDPCDRMPMVWHDLAYQPQATDPRGRERPVDPVAFDTELFAFYRAAIAMRQRFPALRRGAIEFLPADDAAGLLAFRRSDESDTLVVGFNRGDAACRWRIPLAAGEGLGEVFVASGELGKVTVNSPASDATDRDRAAVVELPAHEAAVFRVFRDEP
jgi:cyclomaltodextrinase